MPPPGPSRTLKNESKYPHIVELAVDSHGLDVELSRRIIEFQQITTYSAATRTCHGQARWRILLSLVLCRFADRHRFRRTVWRRVLQAWYLSLARGSWRYAQSWQWNPPHGRCSRERFQGSDCRLSRALFSNFSLIQKLPSAIS